MRSAWFFAVVTLFVLSLSRPSSAEDGLRFRGGVALRAGATWTPEDAVDVGPGVAGQVGVQIDDEWAVYAQPEIDLLVLDCCGGVGAIGYVEHTWSDVVSVGVGPATHLVVGFAFEKESWVQVGGGARIAWNPIHRVLEEGRPNKRRRRVAMTVAFEARAYGTSADVAVIQPMASIGYTAF